MHRPWNSFRRRFDQAPRRKVVDPQSKPLGDDKKFQLLLEAIPDALLVVDPAGQILLVNRQTEMVFGYDRSELLQMPIEQLIPERLRQAHTYHRAHYETAQHVRRMGSGLRLAARHKSGQEIPVDVMLSPTDLNGEPVVLCSVRDVSESRQLMDERENLILQLEQALTNIRKLSGLLPICAWCKRIQDGEGHWKQLESYIRGHSEAEFSHGVCPDCVKTIELELGQDPASP